MEGSADKANFELMADPSWHSKPEKHSFGKWTICDGSTFTVELARDFGSEIKNCLALSVVLNSPLFVAIHMLLDPKMPEKAAKQANKKSKRLSPEERARRQEMAATGVAVAATGAAVALTVVDILLTF